MHYLLFSPKPLRSQDEFSGALGFRREFTNMADLLPTKAADLSQRSSRSQRKPQRQQQWGIGVQVRIHRAAGDNVRGRPRSQLGNTMAARPPPLYRSRAGSLDLREATPLSLTHCVPASAAFRLVPCWFLAVYVGCRWARPDKGAR